MSMGEQEIRALLAIGDMGAYWQRMAKQMEGDRNSAYAQLAERDARIARLEAALSLAENRTAHVDYALFDRTPLLCCRVCLASILLSERNDKTLGHEPDCPFAALATAPATTEPGGDRER